LDYYVLHQHPDGLRAETGLYRAPGFGGEYLQGKRRAVVTHKARKCSGKGSGEVLRAAVGRGVYKRIVLTEEDVYLGHFQVSRTACRPFAALVPWDAMSIYRKPEKRKV
jgi:hypothetical protein